MPCSRFRFLGNQSKCAPVLVNLCAFVLVLASPFAFITFTTKTQYSTSFTIVTAATKRQKRKTMPVRRRSSSTTKMMMMTASPPVNSFMQNLILRNKDVRMVSLEIDNAHTHEMMPIMMGSGSAESSPSNSTRSTNRSICTSETATPSPSELPRWKEFSLYGYSEQNSPMKNTSPTFPKRRISIEEQRRASLEAIDDAIAALHVDDDSSSSSDDDDEEERVDSSLSTLMKRHHYQNRNSDNNSDNDFLVNDRFSIGSGGGRKQLPDYELALSAVQQRYAFGSGRSAVSSSFNGELSLPTRPTRRASFEGRLACSI